MKGRELDVSINGLLVGQLSAHNDLWQFAYDSSWVKDPSSFDLSPTLTREIGVHVDGASNRPVQWYFDNLLPEEKLRTVIAKETEIDAEDAFGLLAWFGAESAGSLILSDRITAAPLDVGLRLLSLEGLSQRIENLPRMSLMHDAPKRMSLAGAQHKMLVVLQAGVLYEPRSGTPSTFILKPNHQGEDYPASVMNEYFTMRLARQLGLIVPNVRRLYCPQPVYLIERFDRHVVANAAGDADAVQRRHVVDTCQLLNKARSFKYSSARLETIAKAIEHCRNKAATRQQLYRWLIFNVLVGNGDNHLKNLSFTVDADGINLAPAYDLLSTAVYATQAFAHERPTWPRAQLAFSLGDAKTFADVTRAHLLDAAAGLGLAGATAARELDRMLKGAPVQADGLIAEIEADAAKALQASPDPEAARAYLGGELRLLRAIRHGVLEDMRRQLSPPPPPGPPANKPPAG